ncbi:MAG TPA: hypothetical protein VJ952_11570 [Opitutales bacterium]|nr:hypothetical protein [Opitutales bacterium]
MLGCVLLPVFAWLFLQPSEVFRLTGEAWANGSWHALWTGHLLHYGGEHFVWDALMFVSFAVLLWKEERWSLWIWMLIAAPVISVGVFLVHPALSEYRGLSALDTMLYVRYFLGGLTALKGGQRFCFALLPLVALATKIIFELITGSALFVGGMGEGVVPLPSAHLAGAMIGLLWFGWRRFLVKRVPRDESSGKIAFWSPACVVRRRFSGRSFPCSRRTNARAERSEGRAAPRCGCVSPDSSSRFVPVRASSYDPIPTPSLKQRTKIRNNGM